MKSIIFDTETTGLPKPSDAPLHEQPKIVEFGFLVRENCETVFEFNQLLDPGPLTPDEIDVITRISKIDPAELVGKPKFGDILSIIEPHFGAAMFVYAHNAPFDRGMLEFELRRLGLGQRDATPWAHWPKNIVCTIAEFRHMFGHKPKLTELYERAHGHPLEQTHRALDDCHALLSSMRKLNYDI